MNHCERAGHLRVKQIRKESRNLMRDELTFVDDGRARKAADVEQLTFAQLKAGTLIGHPLTDDIELALEGFLILDPLAARDKNLNYDRHPRPRDLAALGWVNRHRAPAQELLPLLVHYFFEDRLCLFARLRVARHKHHPDAVIPRRGHKKAEFGSFTRQEIVGKLQQDAGAVTRQRVASAGTAMSQIVENLQAFQHDI